MKDPKKLKDQKPDYVKDPTSTGDPDKQPQIGTDPMSEPDSSKQKTSISPNTERVNRREGHASGARDIPGASDHRDRRSDTGRRKQ